MKITLVGVRDNRRTINWPGLLAGAAIIVALSLVGYAIAHFVFDLLGGAPPIMPGVLLAIVMPLGCVLGIQLRRAFKTPLNELPQLQ